MSKRYIRHQEAPRALGCRWCGMELPDHGQRWVPGHGFHLWAQPTQAQVEARMRARLARQTRPVYTDTRT